MFGKKNKALEDIIKTTHTLNKTYSYSSDGLELNITINVKDKKKMESMIKILTTCADDIKADVNQLQND